MSKFGSSEDERRTLDLDIKSGIEIKDGLAGVSDGNSLSNDLSIGKRNDQVETNMSKFGSSEDVKRTLDLDTKSGIEIKDGLAVVSDGNSLSSDLGIGKMHDQMEIENKVNKFESHEVYVMDLNLSIKSENDLEDEPFDADVGDYADENDLKLQDPMDQVETILTEFEPSEDQMKALDSDLNSEIEIKDGLADFTDEYRYNGYDPTNGPGTLKRHDQSEDETSPCKMLAEISLKVEHKMPMIKELFLVGNGLKNTNSDDDDSDDKESLNFPDCDIKSKHNTWIKKHLLGHKKSLRGPKGSFTSRHKHYLTTEDKFFKCSECNYECHRKDQLKSHLLKHSDLKIFECSECDYKCKQKHQLKTHSLTHAASKLLKCSECDYQCNHKVSLTAHSLTHSNIKLYKCSQCSYGTNRKNNFTTHLLTHTDLKPFKCSECAFECKLKQSLRRHLLTHSTDNVLKCSECNYECNRKEKLKSHFLTHSKIKLFKCSECSYECNYKSNLKAHELTHSNGVYKLYKCAICDHETNSHNNFKIHLLTHSNTKLYQCSECSYQCNQKGNLRVHLLSHSNTKLYTCSQCTYGTNRANNFKTHILSHSKAKLFKCSQCDYETNFKNRLQSHCLNHSDVKLFKCSRCDYGTNRKDYLKNHEQKQHSSSMLKCSECSFETKYKTKLQAHLLKHFWQSYISLWGTGIGSQSHYSSDLFLAFRRSLINDYLKIPAGGFESLPPSVLLPNSQSSADRDRDVSPTGDDPVSSKTISESHDHSASSISPSVESTILVPSTSSAPSAVSPALISQSVKSIEDSQISST